MGNWSEQQEAKKEVKEKDKVRRETLGKFFFDLAKLAFVSKSNFFKLFKYEIGIAPNEFILIERIKRSKELLKEDQSIKEVDFATGFSDTNHFIKNFKTFEGITPKTYQRSLYSDYKIVS